MISTGERFTVELSRDFSSQKSFNTYIVGLKKQVASKTKGHILAWAKNDSGKRYPLAVLEGETPILFFDLKRSLELILGEQYPGAELSNSIVMRLPFDYTALPMWVIGMAFKIMTQTVDLNDVPNFPQFPIDDSADTLASIGLGKASVAPIEWPNSKKYAVMLTHDVDTSWVFRQKNWLELYMSAERQFGMRSAWYVVPNSMDTPHCKEGLEKLALEGHEIGVHGVTHDPSLAYESFESLCEKFSLARQRLSWIIDSSPGYRAPWLSRTPTMRKALKETGYLYDTSSPTVDFNRHSNLSNNGCCTLFPFSSEGLSVLPITLPMDAAYYALGKNPKDFWLYIWELIESIKTRGGLVVVTTHIQPHHSANFPMLDGYTNLLNKLSLDDDAWFALPREIAKETNPS
jgi:hypothetical protein